MYKIKLGQQSLYCILRKVMTNIKKFCKKLAVYKFTRIKEISEE